MSKSPFEPNDVERTGRTAGEEPEKRVVHAMPYVIDASGLDPHWLKAEASDDTEVVRVPNYSGDARKVEDPHYTDKNYGNGRKLMAERIAEAVKSAILIGDLDPDDLMPSN